MLLTNHVYIHITSMPVPTVCIYCIIVYNAHGTTYIMLYYAQDTSTILYYILYTTYTIYYIVYIIFYFLLFFLFIICVVCSVLCVLRCIRSRSFNYVCWYPPGVKKWGVGVREVNLNFFINTSLRQKKERKQ